MQPPPIVNSPQSSQAPKRSIFKLRISPIAAIPAVLALVILMAPLLLSGTDADRTAYAYGAVAGSWGARVIGALVIAWLVALPMRGSRVATTITFSILVVLCPMGYSTAWMNDLSLGPAGSSPPVSNSVTKMRARESDRMDRLRKDFKDDGEVDLEAAIETISDTVKDLERNAGTKTDIESRIFRANASVLRAIQEAQTNYMQALQTLMDEGAFEVTESTSSLESLNSRIAQAKRVVETNEAVIKIFGEIRRRYSNAYRAEGLSSDEVRTAASAAARASNAPLVLGIRRADNEVMEAGIVMLEVLRDTHGQWSLENGQILFDEDGSDEMLERYNDAYSRMMFHAQEQLRLQSELLDVETPDVLPDAAP